MSYVYMHSARAYGRMRLHPLCVAQVTNALGHAESCLDYMSRLQQPNVFRFCAIPQARRGGGRGPPLYVWARGRAEVVQRMRGSAAPLVLPEPSPPLSRPSHLHPNQHHTCRSWR